MKNKFKNGADVVHPLSPPPFVKYANLVGPGIYNDTLLCVSNI